MKIIFNIFTKNFDYVRGLVGAGTTPTSQKTIYQELLTTGTTFSHSANAQWTGAEVLIVDMADMMTLTNDIATMYEAHRIDAGEHTSGIDVVNTITAPAATDYLTTYNLAVDIMTQYIAHNADAELGAGWVYHAAQNALTHVLSFGSITSTASALMTALNEIRTKMKIHDADGTSHGTDSLHQVTAAQINSLVWNDSLYVPRQNPSDVLNSAIIDSVVSDYAKITFYF